MIIDEYLYNYNTNRANSLSKTNSIKYLNSYKDYHIDNFLADIFKNTLTAEENTLKLLVYNYYFQCILYLWIDLYFTKHKKEYLKILDDVALGNDKLQISKKDLMKFKNYKLYYKFKIMRFLHLGYIYMKLIRPFFRKF